MTKHPHHIKNPALWSLVFIISVLLMWIALYGFRSAWLLKPEETIVHWSPMKKKLYEVTEDSLFDNRFPQQFVFINAAYDIALSRTLPLGGRDSLVSTVTDRAKLADLFRWLKQNDTSYALVVCDIVFTDPSSDKTADDSLNASIVELIRKRKALFAGNYDPYHGQYTPSYFPAITAPPLPGMPLHLGNTTYDSPHKGEFLDYTLALEGGSIKSLPLLIFERTQNATTTDARFFSFAGESGPMALLKVSATGESYLAENNFVPEIFFTTEDIEKIPTYESSGGKSPDAAMIRLSSAVSFGGIPLHLLLGQKKNKIVLIGNFGNDQSDSHETMFGRTSGPVILLNIYQNMLSKENKLTILFLLTLWVVFMLLSVDIVFNGLLAPFFIRFVKILLLLGVPLFLFKALSKIKPGFKLAVDDLETWIYKQAHNLFLFFVALFCNFFFNKITNMVVVAFVVFCLYKLVKYLGKKHASKL